MVVVVEQTGRFVTGNVDVRPPVVVEIRCTRRHAIRSNGEPVVADRGGIGRPPWPGDTCCLRDILERPVAAIVIENVGSSGPALGAASHGNPVIHAEFVGTGERGDTGIKIHIVSDKEVQVSITVIVQKAASSVPLRTRTFLDEPCALGHIREGTVAIIVIQDVSTPVGYKEVIKAIVIVIADAATLAPARPSQSSLLRHIGKRPVAIIVKEEIRGRGAAWKPVESAAVHKKNVEPAVVVVIEEGYATTHLLEEVLIVMYAPVDIERSAQAGL